LLRRIIGLLLCAGTPFFADPPLAMRVGGTGLGSGPLTIVGAGFGDIGPLNIVGRTGWGVGPLTIVGAGFGGIGPLTIVGVTPGCAGFAPLPYSLSFCLPSSIIRILTCSSVSFGPLGAGVLFIGFLTSPPIMYFILVVSLKPFMSLTFLAGRSHIIN
jgi:hypothetical protein